MGDSQDFEDLRRTFSQFRHPGLFAEPEEIPEIQEQQTFLDRFFEQLPSGVKERIPELSPEQRHNRLEHMLTVQMQVVEPLTGRQELSPEQEVVTEEELEERIRAEEQQQTMLSAIHTERMPAITTVLDDVSDYRTRNIRAVRRNRRRKIHLDSWWDIVLFIGLYTIIASVSFLITGKPGFLPIQIYTTAVWTGYMVIASVGLLGLFLGMFLVIGLRRDLRHQEAVDNLVVYLVPSITKNSVLPSLVGVIDSILESAPIYTPNFVIQVTYNEGAEAAIALIRHYTNPDDKRRILFIAQPKSFQDGFGTTKKCLANQYSLLIRRYMGVVGSDIFVIHLDDDTKITPDLCQAYAYYIEHQSHKYVGAQGPLTYAFQLGGQGFWGKFCTLMDSVRGGDDMLRFRSALLLFHRPVFGLHGENLIMRSDAEDALGWSFGPTLVEDALFAMLAIKAYGGTFAYLHGCTIGASPENIPDMIIQRARWCQGLIPLSLDKRLIWYSRLFLGYSTFNWVLGFLQNIGVVMMIAVVLRDFNVSPIDSRIVWIWSLCYAYQVFMYIKGYFMNLDASDAPLWQYLLCPLLIPMMLIFSLLEAAGALWGTWNWIRGKTDFPVINKGGGQQQQKKS